MTKAPGQSPETSELRRCAEERLKKITSVAPPLTEAESQQLIHELQVHQIELELQNEELIQTRAQLEQSLEKYTDLYDFAPISYFLLAADSTIQELNLAGAALLGQARSSLIGRRFGLFLPVASRPVFTDFLGKVLVGEAREVCEITLALDPLPLRYLQLEGVSKGIGADRQCRITAMDITERKQVELLLVYQQIVNSSPDGLALVSTDYRYQIVNHIYRRNTGLFPEQIVGQTVAAIMGPTVFDQIIKPRLDRCLAGETVTYAEWFDYPLRNRRYVELTYSPCHDARRVAIIGAVVVSRDITERKQAEEALRQSEARFRLIFDQAPAGMAIVSPDFHIRQVNDAMCRITGYSSAELTAFHVSQITHPDDWNADRAQALRLLAGEIDHFQMEKRYIHKQGDIVWVHLLVRVITNAADQLTCFLANVQDITERKQIEAALQASKDRLRLGIQVAGLGLAEIDYRTQTNHLSAEAARLFGLGDAPITVPRATVHATFHPEDRLLLMLRIEESLDPAGPGWFAMDHRVVWPDGQVRWLRVHKQVFFYGKGSARQPVCAILAAFDITMEKNTEEALRKNQEQLQLAHERFIAALHTSPVVVFSQDHELRYTWIHNPALGYQMEEVIGTTDHDLFERAEDADRLVAIKRRVLETGVSTREEVAIFSAGIMRWYDLAVQPQRTRDEIIGVLCVAVDTTGRKQIEAALRESEERLKLFIRYAPSALAMFDRTMRYLYASNRWLSDYGLGDRDLQGLSHYDVFPEIPEAWKEFHRRGLAGEILQSEADRFERSDGSVQWARWEIRPWHNLNQSIGGIVIFAEDITERVRVEETLKAERDRFEKIVATVPGLITSFRLRPDGSASLPYASPAIQDLYGLRPEDVAESAAPLWAMIHPDDLVHIEASVAASAQTMTPWQGEFRVQHPAKGEIWIEGRSMPVREPDGSILWHGYLQDITERKQTEATIIRVNQQLELRVKQRTTELSYTVSLLKQEMELRREQQEQLLQARKLEAIGQLTGGIAHDFNNLLTVIKANLEILRDKIRHRLDADDHLSIEDALSAARDAAELTSGLLTFSRRQPLQWRSVNVNSMVQGLKRMLSRSMGPAITLMIETDPKVPTILTDPGQLQSSLMNLVLNARDAMPKGGTITLSTATVEVLSEGVAGADRVSGRYVVITVTDSGVGMDATTLSRVTEPFFTTKRPGMGTGLGLSIRHYQKQ